MFHIINWINNKKDKKKTITRARMKRLKEKQRHHITKGIFLFHVTTYSGMVSELVHPKLKKSNCSRA